MSTFSLRLAGIRQGGKRLPSSLLLLPAVLFLGIFFFYPLVRIFAFALEGQLLAESRTWSLLWRVLGFTVYQAALSTLFTLLVALPLAFLFARYTFPGKSLWRAMISIPFLLPTLVVAAGFNAFLGDRGWVNLGLMRLFGLSAPPVPFTGTLAAILLAHVFYNTTLLVRLLIYALEHLDPRLEQAARLLGADGRRVFWHVTLPLLRPALLAGASLVFLFDFTSFGVILLLGGARFSTLEVEIYVQGVHMLNLPLAAFLSMVQLLCTAGLGYLYTYLLRRAAVPISPRAAQSNVRAPKRLQERAFVTLTTLLLIGLFILPMLSLPLRSVLRLEAARGERGQVQYGLTLDYYREIFINRRGSIFYVPPLQAMRNSLVFASLTIAFSLSLGIPAALALRQKSWPARLADGLFMLPLGASSVTLGLGFILAFRRAVTSPILIPLAHTLMALPLVIRTLQPALASLPVRLREAALVLGASPWRAWWEVEWPILWRAILVAATFAFTVSVGEFGATLLVARPEFPTLPLAIYRFLSQPGGLNYGQAMAMTTLLMFFTASGLLLIERFHWAGREF
ncbi:MAG: ABC transporter permease [Anaerolineales bacterium]